MDITAIWYQMKEFLIINFWLLQLAAIVVLTFLASHIEKKLYLKFYPRAQRTRKIWDDTLLFSIHKPLHVLIWLTGILLSVDVLSHFLEVQDQITKIIHLTKQVLIVVTFFWSSIRYIGKVEDRYIIRTAGKNKKLDKSTIHAISQISRIAGIIIAGLVCLEIFNVPIAGLLAFGGVGGVAVGFAAKDTLANFFGAFMIFFDRPFTVGDWIYSPDKDIEGTVEDIGWRLTRIRRFDQRPFYLPNGIFSNIGVVNASRMTNRRILTKIGVRYHDAAKIPTIVNDIEEMLTNHPEIDTNQTCFVKFVEFAESSLNLQIYTFTKTTEWVKYLSVQQDVFCQAIDIITRYGAECAFPTTTLEVPNPIAVQQETP